MLGATWISNKFERGQNLSFKWSNMICWAPPGHHTDEENRMLRSILYTYDLTLGFVSWLACPIFGTEKQIEVQLTRAARQ